MSRRLIAVVVAVAALAMIVAACGGGSDSTETASSISKAEFVKKGNAICAKGEKEVEDGVEKFAEKNNLSERNPASSKQVEELAEKILVPAVRKQLNELRALGIPSGDEEEVEAIFAAVEEALKETEEDPSVFGQEGGVGPFAKANKLSREYGLTVCGSEPEEEGAEPEGGGEPEGGAEPEGGGEPEGLLEPKGGLELQEGN